MTRHCFDPEIAAKVGINAAVIYQNLVWWCEKNAANGKHIHDGKAWTYNSMKAFEALFPYLTGNQIRTALDKLEKADLIESGNFNQVGYDRTKWYCVKSQIHLGKITNGFGKNHEPIPDSKPDSKPDVGEPDGSLGLFSANSIPEKPETPVEILQQVVREETARDFAAHRKAMKKPLTVEAARRLVKKLANHPDPDAVFDLSIENGWLGVFPEKTGGPRNETTSDSGADFARRAAERYAARRMDYWPDQGSSVPLLPPDHADGSAGGGDR